MEVLIIEDEAPAFRRLQNLLSDIDPALHILEVVDSVEDAVRWIEGHPMPDLIFSDIQLADGISFEVFDQVDVRCPVIFTTAFDEYTLQAFRVNSIDYLLKPINREDLERSLLKLQEMRAQLAPVQDNRLSELLDMYRRQEKTYKTRFLVRRGDRLLSISQEQIAYFHTAEGVVCLTNTEGVHYLVDHSLDELETLLDPARYFRLNRQYIACIDCIAQVHQHFKGKLKVTLAPEAAHDILVSRERSSLFKRWLGGA